MSSRNIIRFVKCYLIVLLMTCNVVSAYRPSAICDDCDTCMRGVRHHLGEFKPGPESCSHGCYVTYDCSIESYWYKRGFTGVTDEQFDEYVRLSNFTVGDFVLYENETQSIYVSPNYLEGLAMLHIKYGYTAYSNGTIVQDESRVVARASCAEACSWLAPGHSDPFSRLSSAARAACNAMARAALYQTCIFACDYWISG